MTPEEREKVRRYVARLDVQRSTLEREIESTLALARGRTPEQLDLDLQRVVRSGWQILLSRGDREQVLRFRDPLPEHSKVAWRELVERRRRERGEPARGER